MQREESRPPGPLRSQLPHGRPPFSSFSPDRHYHVRDAIDPGDNRLDEHFGVILDFLHGHSFNAGQTEPKAQELAQGSATHLASQVCFLGLKMKGTTHFRLLVAQETSYALLATILPDAGKNEICFLPRLASQRQRQFII